MYRRSFKDYFGRDRKALYIVLGIVMISILTLSVVYAALSTTLNINGQAEVSSASWDIHLDNVQLNSMSATTTAPSITSPTTATFSTTLTTPGDFYEFTIDVVNDGSIDAMIDGVTKTPTLTESQAKYLNYIVEYQNGESINNKQLVAKNSFVRLKVKLEFRKDITASDLPTTSETLNLAFTVNYTQADETGINVKDGGAIIPKAYEVISGDLNTVGSEVAIGDDYFYIISSDEDSITMLTKLAITNDAIPVQVSEAPTFSFSSTFYWKDSSGLKAEYGSEYPAYVYDKNCSLYYVVEKYKQKLESLGARVEEARLIKLEELRALGCKGTSCSNAPSWVSVSKYWTGTASSNYNLYMATSASTLVNGSYGTPNTVRPVITITI